MRMHGIFAGSRQLAADDYVGIIDEIPGAALVGGVRRMYSGHTGNLMQIIRASDSAATVVGSTSNGGLDTSTINSFCAGTTGYVLRLYGQDDLGYGYDIIGKGSGSSTTELPIIYTGGSVVTLNGQPAIQVTHPRMFSWEDTSIPIGNFVTVGAAGGDKRVTAMMVGQQGSSTGPYKITLTDSGENEYLWFYESSGAERIEFMDTAASLATQFTDNAQKSWIWQVEGGKFRGYENGTLLNEVTNNSAQSSTTTGVIFNIGGLAFSSRNMEGYIQEIAIWPTAVSSSAIYSNVNSYYSFA